MNASQLRDASPGIPDDETHHTTALPPQSLDFQDLPPLDAIAPDMNSQRMNPLRNDGAERTFRTRNTSRRENRSQDTPADAASPAMEPPPSVDPSAEDGPEVARDRQTILHLVRMRVLSYSQLARLTYFNADKTVARRRLRRLHERGWVELWDRPVAFGGTPRYAYPTRRALVWANAVMDKAVTGSPLEPLVRLMTPATPRQPWKFQAGIIPLFLTHTEEANDVLIAWLRASGERVLWASSWDCPFPEHIEWRMMPQPDYVLVLQREGEPCLVFGEHDRGTEGREVVARKLRVYRTWFETPDILARTIGFRSFRLFVTVAGERASRRLEHLTQLVRDEGAEGFTTLMLGGPEAVPVLPPLNPNQMDFAHCSLCRSRVPLDAEVCSSCGAPTHQLAREELTADASTPPIDYAAETDAPDLQEPPPHHPRSRLLDQSAAAVSEPSAPNRRAAN